MSLGPKRPISRDTKIQKSNHQEKLLRDMGGFDLSAMFVRQDRIHKFTTELVRQRHAIVVEALRLIAVAHSLARGFRGRFREVSMCEIVRQLKYKCALYDRKLIFGGRWFRGSRRCSGHSYHQRRTRI